MTSKKKSDTPAYEPPIVSYYTLRDPAEPAPPAQPVIAPTVQSADNTKEN